MDLITRTCLDCGDILHGRADQRFCSVYCRSSFHYKKNLQKDSTLYKKINTILKNNRRILKRFNPSGQAQIKKEMLIDSGLNFNYFTHYWKAKNGNVYFFCFEYGYRNLNDGKYMLIHWQEYMN